MKRVLLIVAALSALAFPFSSLATPPKGAGSTAAAKLYAAWAAEWAAKKGTEGIEYAGVGSSAGLKAIRAGNVDFGASDVAPSREELQRDGLVAFPTAISGVVPVVNLLGIAGGKLRLTGPLLAELLAGRISRWDAPELRKLNPSLRLPALPVRLIVREDGSGTTYVLTNYLAKVSPEWKTQFGNDFLIKWPVGVTAVKGGGKVVETVKNTEGAIGYVEYGQAVDGDLAWVALQNKAGKWPEPGQKSFASALRDSMWRQSGDFEDMLTDSRDFDAWPITAGTFIVMRKTQSDPARAVQVLSFFTWAFTRGDPIAAKLNWIPLPQNTQARVVKEMSQLQDKTGQPILFSYVQ